MYMYFQTLIVHVHVFSDFRRLLILCSSHLILFFPFSLQMNVHVVIPVYVYLYNSSLFV
jgi:hypothetical protein